MRRQPQARPQPLQKQKQRNLDANPHMAVTTGTTGASGWNAGKDIVVEGTALRVTAAEALQALADAWFAKHGEDWRFEVRGEEFVELSHSGGSTEGGARVYRVKPAKVIAFGDTHGQTTLPLLRLTTRLGSTRQHRLRHLHVLTA
jgi:hypothetical protein